MPRPSPLGHFRERLGGPRRAPSPRLGAQPRNEPYCLEFAFDLDEFLFNRVCELDSRDAFEIRVELGPSLEEDRDAAPTKAPVEPSKLEHNVRPGLGVLA